MIFVVIMPLLAKLFFQQYCWSCQFFLFVFGDLKMKSLGIQVIYQEVTFKNDNNKNKMCK